jgi:hypothetical protein
MLHTIPTPFPDSFSYSYDGQQVGRISCRAGCHPRLLTRKQGYFASNQEAREEVFSLRGRPCAQRLAAAASESAIPETRADLPSGHWSKDRLSRVPEQPTASREPIQGQRPATFRRPLSGCGKGSPSSLPLYSVTDPAAGVTLSVDRLRRLPLPRSRWSRTEATNLLLDRGQNEGWATA